MEEVLLIADRSHRRRPRDDPAHRRPRPRSLGLPRQRLADPQAGRAACRPRGLDGQVPADRGRRRRQRSHRNRQDRRCQRRSG